MHILCACMCEEVWQASRLDCWGAEGSKQQQKVGEQQLSRGEDDVIQDLQNHKFAWSQRKDREEGEADDETGSGSEIAKGKYQQAVPSTHYSMLATSSHEA